MDRGAWRASVHGVAKNQTRLSDFTFRFLLLNFPGGSDGKASVYNAGGPRSIPGSGRSSGEGNGNPYPVLLAGKSHGQRSLVGYSPWGRKESDTTERLHFLFLLKTFPELSQRSLIRSYCYKVWLAGLGDTDPPKPQAGVRA